MILTEFQNYFEALTAKKMLFSLAVGAAGAPAIYYLEKYVFNDWEFIARLIIIIIIDTALGLRVAWKYKKVSSEGFGQVLPKIFMYGALLVLTHNVRNFQVRGHDNELFTWFDYAMYAGIVGKEALSIIEKCALLYPKRIPKFLLEKLRYFDDHGKLPPGTPNKLGRTSRSQGYSEDLTDSYDGEP